MPPLRRLVKDAGVSGTVLRGLLGNTFKGRFLRLGGLGLGVAGANELGTKLTSTTNTDPYKTLSRNPLSEDFWAYNRSGWNPFGWKALAQARLLDKKLMCIMQSNGRKILIQVLMCL